MAMASMLTLSRLGHELTDNMRRIHFCLGGSAFHGSHPDSLASYHLAHDRPGHVGRACRHLLKRARAFPRTAALAS
jgi:hypothetical protein